MYNINYTVRKRQSMVWYEFPQNWDNYVVTRKVTEDIIKV